jgi:hypothetical protein
MYFRIVDEFKKGLYKILKKFGLNCKGFKTFRINR